MKPITILFIVLFSFHLILIANSSAAVEQVNPNPYPCFEKARETKQGKVREEIEKSRKHDSNDPSVVCHIAELMKRDGNDQAGKYYKKLIELDDREPAYELFFADYLRNYRGAKHPLFPDAESHYYAAWEKLIKNRKDQLLDCGKNWTFDCDTKNRIYRGLITLYQEDGYPLLYWESNFIEGQQALERPYLFFSTINKLSRLTTEFDEVDDIRNFTSEALFSSKSKIKKSNQPLTQVELKNIIRTKEQFISLNRLRLRYRDMPVLDLFYGYNDIQDAQITDFSKPNEFNNVRLNEYGLSLNKPLSFSQNVDLFLEAMLKKVTRKGVIELNEDVDEEIDHIELKAVISRFFGPDKFDAEIVYVFQNIAPQIPGRQERDRKIIGGTFTYHVFRQIGSLKSDHSSTFGTRGIDLFSGFVLDTENFGSLDVKKNDFFVGTSFKGLGDFDISIQPTVFTSEAEGDSSQDNAQYRTNVLLLYRIIDEEKVPGIPEKKMGIHPSFLHLVFPFSHDVAIDGPVDYENFKVGVGLSTKFFTQAVEGTRYIGTTFLASIRYDYQRFRHFDKDLDLLSFNVSMGF